MNDTFPHDTSGGAASANSVRGHFGSTVGPSGSHYIIGPLQKASGPGKKEKTTMSHFWDTHHTVGTQSIIEIRAITCPNIMLMLIVLLAKTGPRCISFRCKITVSLAQGAVHDAEADVANPVFVRSTILRPTRSDPNPDT